MIWGIRVQGRVYLSFLNSKRLLAAPSFLKRPAWGRESAIRGRLVWPEARQGCWEGEGKGRERQRVSWRGRKKHSGAAKRAKRYSPSRGCFSFVLLISMWVGWGWKAALGLA